MARVNERAQSFTGTHSSHTFIHKRNEPYLPLLASRRASPYFGQYSFSIPVRVESRVDVSGWLQSEVVYPPADGHRSHY